MPGMKLLGSPAETVALWIKLVRQHPATGPELFDLQLAATMIANGVRRIYTFNASDFKHLNNIEAVVP